MVIFLVITILSLLPPKSGVELPTNDKLSHFLAYSAISLNVCLLFTSFHLRLIYILAGILAFSALIEFLQQFVGRSCSFYDFLANTGGVIIGVGIYALIGRYLQPIIHKT